MRNTRLIRLLALWGIVWAAAFPARAGELTIRYYRHFVEDKKLNLELGIVGEISYDTIDAIRNGITANLHVSFHLVRTGGIFDSGRELAGQRNETFTIAFDVWENTFLIQDKTRKKEYQASSPTDILRQISRNMSPVRMSVPPPDMEGKYVVKGRIKIQTIKLFPPFGLFLYIFDPWNYDSGWISTEVFEIVSPRG
jgi:hypothetical protein